MEVEEGKSDNQAPSAASNIKRANAQKVVLEWEDINYWVRIKNSSKSRMFNAVYQNNHILNNVKGRAESGQLLAIMGPTGCGKTSLLNVLAARVPAQGESNIKLQGTVKLDGKLRVDSAFRKLSAYVLQDDKLYAHLTVKETLSLAAQFYLPTTMSEAEKEEIVLDVITELGLLKAKDTIIGNEKVRGVSGGERKRANIGTQMISRPSILFLDEPTSGLDAFQSQSVMECMKSMAESGRLVISVIHQPRSSIYKMFDQLLLLSLGRVMYMGTTANAVRYFDSIGFACPKTFNPSDYFLDILSPDNRSEEADTQSMQQIDKIGAAWITHVNSPPQGPYGTLVSVSDKGGGEAAGERMQPVVMTWSEWYARFCRNFSLLFHRAFTEQRRDVGTIGIKLFFTLFFGSILGGIYSKNSSNQKGITNITGLLFVVCINQAFNSVISCLNIFPKEKTIVNRERSANAYGVLEYFTSKFLAELPMNVFPSLLYACVVYFSANLRKARFGVFVGILMLETMTGISLGLAISAIMPSLEAALALGPPLVIIALIFGGFYINITTLPIVANWFPFVSFLKWTFEALCINEFRGATFSCNGGIMGACEHTGAEVLSRLGFGDRTVADAILGLSCLFIVFTLAAYVFLHQSQLRYIQLGFSGKNMRDASASSSSASSSV